MPSHGNFCCSKLPSFWPFVTSALVNQHIKWHSDHFFFYCILLFWRWQASFPSKFIPSLQVTSCCLPPQGMVRQPALSSALRRRTLRTRGRVLGEGEKEEGRNASFCARHTCISTPQNHLLMQADCGLFAYYTSGKVWQDQSSDYHTTRE